MKTVLLAVLFSLGLGVGSASALTEDQAVTAILIKLGMKSPVAAAKKAARKGDVRFLRQLWEVRITREDARGLHYSARPTQKLVGLSKSTGADRPATIPSSVKGSGGTWILTTHRPIFVPSRTEARR